MNILITNISILPVRTGELSYSVCMDDYDGTVIKACQTNESILKAISHIKSLKKTGGINKIIALTSWKSSNDKDNPYKVTAYDFYKEKARECFGDIQIIPVKIEENNNKAVSISTILSQVCSEISTDDIVYIDSAGGVRTTSNLIQLLAKILRYKGIKNPYNLYSDIQNLEAPKIYDTADFQRMTDLADALNEFITTGKSEQLSSSFDDIGIPSTYKDLLEVMNSFSDQIRLGNIDNLDSTIGNLNNSIDLCKTVPNETDNDIGLVILKEFLPVIEKKLVGNMEEGVDYYNITKWCIENGLIQQAITIFNEKIPRYIFSKGYIKAIEEIRTQALNNAKNNGYDWEYIAFWELLLAYGKETKEGNPLIKEFKDCLQNKKESKNSTITKQVKYLKSFSFPVREYQVENKYPHLRNLLKTNFTSKMKFYNAVCNNDSVISELLGLEPDKTGVEEKRSENLKSKFYSIKRLETNSVPNGFEYGIKKDKVIQMLCGFAYVKSLRNQTNHASSDELLNEEQKNLLSGYGYSFTDTSLKTIKSNVENALSAFDFTSKKDERGSNSEKEATQIFSTDLNVGDMIIAKCVDKKIVRISGYDYDIQLVIPEGDNPRDYINTTMQVEIKQISKLGKICQVRFIKYDKQP